MTKDRPVRKRCGRCGWVGRVRPRERRCKRQQVAGGYACWGELARVATVRPVREVRRSQDVAQRKLEHARRMVTEKTRAMGRLATSLHAWERKAAHYARRASMTDAEVQAERERRVARAARPRRRAITLEREVLQ